MGCIFILRNRMLLLFPSGILCRHSLPVSRPADDFSSLCSRCGIVQRSRTQRKIHQWKADDVLSVFSEKPPHVVRWINNSCNYSFHIQLSAAHFYQIADRLPSSFHSERQRTVCHACRMVRRTDYCRAVHVKPLLCRPGKVIQTRRRAGRKNSTSQIYGFTKPVKSSFPVQQSEYTYFWNRI